MDARGRDAERGRLQRAAYGRHATDADREALAAFERREAAVSAAPQPVGADRLPASAVRGCSGFERAVGASPSGTAAEPPVVGAAVGGRRFGLRAVLASALVGLLLGAGAVVAVDAAAPADALDVFSAAPSHAPRDSASAAFELFASDLLLETLPFAGPVLLTTTERWDVYGFLYTDASAVGGQKICLGLVPPRPTRSAASGASCADRVDFQRTGLRIGVSAPGTGDIGAEAIWRPDGGVELTED